LAVAAGVAAVTFGFAVFQARSERRGLERNLASQSVVLAQSLGRTAEPLVDHQDYTDLQVLADRFHARDQLDGVAVYDSSARLVAATDGLFSRGMKGLPAVAKVLESSRPLDEKIQTPVGRLQVVTVPLKSENTTVGALAVFHDLAYIDAEAAGFWRRTAFTVGVQTLVITAITLLLIRSGVIRPLQHMSSWLRQLHAGHAAKPPAISRQEGFESLTTEATRLASSLTAARAAAETEARLRESGESTWTAERLRVFAQTRLAGGSLFAVSNREPYEHFRRGGTLQYSVPPSGLVTALEPVLRASDGTWVAQASGEADREASDEHGRVRVPPDHHQYTLRRVWLTSEQVHGFYLGFANEGLWPLCHIAHTRPVFRKEDWEQYQAVNRRFADALLEEAGDEESPLVLVQDYHFALVPKMIKESRPNARVAIFWHIPWPNPEAFAICPWQREVLAGMLGADLIGFHIQAHCLNFLDTVDRTLESRIEREHFAVNRNGRHTLVRPFPISVAIPETLPAFEMPYAERISTLAKLGVEATLMGVGVDRLDYTKGIPERFRGIERFLELYPQYQGTFTFVQIGSPSRGEIQRYKDLAAEVAREAERINRRLGNSHWKPIVLLNRQHSHQEILPYYRLANVCMVTPLHDGMNLVAKEFVAARDDGEGVLILSRFAGASHDLQDALTVNPYDTEELAEALRRALEMPQHECQARMERMRATVRDRNIYRWAGDLIGQLCDIPHPGRYSNSEREEAAMSTAGGAEG
jgi:trehalose 6-phosphate synthase